jgi:hypothetical protein
VLGSDPDVAVAKEPRLVWRYSNDQQSDELRSEHAIPMVVNHVHASFAAFLRQHGASRGTAMDQTSEFSAGDDAPQLPAAVCQRLPVPTRLRVHPLP